MTTIRELAQFSQLYIVVAFFVGLLFGSFLNVCIARLPKHESVIHPKSRCMSCSHAIRWYDNVPLFSFLLLRGRCRDCTKKIPWRYPAVEVAFALWLAVLVWRWFTIPSFFTGIFGLASSAMERDITTRVWVGEGMSVLVPAILGFLLIGLMVMDWQTQRLPDAFTLTGIAVGFVLTCVQAFFLAPGEGDIKIDTTHQLRMSSPGSFASQGNVFMTGSEALIWERILAICGAALLLFTISAIYKAARKRDGMGMGDVKLLAMIAAFLGFGESLFALFIGVVTAAVYGIILLGRRRAAATTRLPFGSFLAGGGLFAALFGPRIVSWYTNLLH